MDTKTVAARLKTTPKVLRRFLRSKGSTYQAVGSSQRYEFTEADIPELSRRFNAWADTKATAKAPEIAAEGSTSDDVKRPKGDEAVWAEEEARNPAAFMGLEDIRLPGVRARVKAAARAQEARLEELLIARGMHVSQGWTSSAATR